MLGHKENLKKPKTSRSQLLCISMKLKGQSRQSCDLLEWQGESLHTKGPQQTREGHWIKVVKSPGIANLVGLEWPE